MKILLCHNSYQQRGGEDVVFEQEGRLLESKGHEVIRYQRSNDELMNMGKLQSLRKLMWNRQAEDDISNLIEQHRPQILHCTNTFPLISPSVYRAAKSNAVGVIQSLHNYRLICPAATQLRDGAPCEDCSGKRVAWPSVYHGCYRNSRSASAAVTAMLAYHNAIGTWSNSVDRFIVLSDFMKQTFVRGGLAADKIRVKANFIGDQRAVGDGGGNYAVYLGRLSEEKGIGVLLDAWKLLKTDLELRIMGDGPLREEVEAQARTDPRIKVLGHVDSEVAYETLGDAAFLVVPSIWNEPFGLNVIEAFAKGTPVVASDIGTLTELVKPGENGALFTAGSPEELRSSIVGLATRPDLLRELRLGARKSFEAKFTGDKNYEILSGIYDEVIEENLA